MFDPQAFVPALAAGGHDGTGCWCACQNGNGAGAGAAAGVSDY